MTECSVESSAEVLVDLNEEKPMRVLHVDDEPSLLRITKQCLEAEDSIQVDSASSVEEAMEKLKKETYDAVVSDYKMPGKDGLEFLKELRQIGNTVPFVIFTGRGREEVAIQALNLGADQYVNKTGDPETVYCELEHALRRTVERKKAETALEALGEKYRRLFESTIEGVLINGSDGKVSSLNLAAAKILGYGSPKELIGKPAVELYADPESRTRLLQELTEKGYVKERELAWKRKDGSLIEILASVTVQKDEKGNMLRTEGIIRDVTEKKKADEALKRSERKYRDFADSLPEIAFEVDEKGNVTFFNRRASEILGYSQGDFRSMNIFQFLIPEDRDRVKENIQKILKGEKSRGNEYALLRKDGSTFPALALSNRIIGEDGKSGVRGVIINISEQKKIEEKLRESEEKSVSLFRGNPEATVYTDPDMHILDVNPRFASLFGYSLDEVRGKHLDLVVVPKSLIEEAQMLDRKAVGGHVYHDTVRMRKGGSLIPVSISAAPIFIQGQLAGYIWVYKDVSAQKSAEKKLALMNEKLRVVGGLTRHDVRNKLSIITGNIFLNRKRLTDHPETFESFKDMESACEQIVRIFDFAKDYEMLGVEELKYVDVEKIVNEAVSLFPSLHGAQIVNRCHGLTVLADSLLRQLFYNLIDNSLKHGHKVSAIRMYRGKDGENMLKLVYEDDGVGIPADEKLRLFKEGYSDGKGSGYGLYLIKKIAEVYGWTMRETGESGKGAQFVITIPETDSNGKMNYRIA
jgi:PAS domain S-box-containing protein